MQGSGITLKETLAKLYSLKPAKVMFNDAILYNNYDSNIEITPGVYGESFLPELIIPARLHPFDDYVVDSVLIEFIDQVSIITLLGHSAVTEGYSKV